jgi:hypothetical protein
MKRLILIKQSNAIDLAHLYEHIFCMRIEEFFYNKHLFQYLDYSLVGKTYHGGVVYIDLELYTQAAISLAKELQALAITLDEATITTAVMQLLAEEEEPLSGTGYDDVKQALETLHEQPWQDIDDVELVDVKGVRRRTKPFYIAEGKPLPARKLITGVLIDTAFAATHRELLPLFRQFAWLINSTLQGALPEANGYYSLKDVYKNTKETIGLFNTFKVANTNDMDVQLPDDLETCLEVVHDLQQYGAFAHYMDELCNLSYYDRPNLAPNLEKNYEDTLIFIGPKGWQKIATNENYELLLKHMSIEVKFGRDKVSQALVG